MKNRFIVRLLILFVLSSLIELFLLIYWAIGCEKIIENIIQFMLLNVAILAFYTCYEDNRRLNIELVFEFDKRWDEIIKIIDDEFNKIKKEFADKKAEIEDRKYLNQLSSLKRTQNKLKFLLEKINHYEDKNIKVKSYIDIYSVVNGIEEAVDLILDVKKLNSEPLKELLDLYKQNLGNINEYIKRIDSYKDSDKMTCTIDTLIENIDIYTNEDTNEDTEVSTNSEDSESKILIGESVGNNRYFKSKDESNIILTSRNWNEEDNEKYVTWYRIPKKGKKSLDDKKDYYFIVREANENNEFPYLYISNNNLKDLVQEKDIKNTDDNSIHFYFKWDKKNYELGVIDERNGITLEADKYELGKVQLRDEKLFKN